MNFVAAWARAFALAVGVELLVVVPLLGGGQARSRTRRAVAVLVGQLVTHPLVWFVFSALPLSRPVYLVIAEAWAVTGEAILYALVFHDVRWRRILAISTLANAASFLAGIGLRALNVWL